MTLPVTLEDILSLQFARDFMQVSHSHSALRVEVDGEAMGLRKLIDADILQSTTLRRIITAVLSRSESDVPEVATVWVTLVKTRVEALDYWSHVYAASGLCLAGISAIGAIAFPNEMLRYTVVVASAALATCLGMKKFEIDRRKLWYKYVLCHLEAMKVRAKY